MSDFKDSAEITIHPSLEIEAVDLDDRDGRYWSAIDALYDKKSAADKWKGEYGWEEYGGMPEEFVRTAELQPKLVVDYYPLLQEPRDHGEFAALLNIIRKAPEYARGLKSIFESYPDLSFVYDVAIMSGYRFTHDQQIQDSVSPYLRISASTNAEVIEARLAANRELYASLTGKLASITPTEDVPGYPQWDLAHLYDVATLRAFELPYGKRQRKSIKFMLIPTEPNGYYFVDQELQLVENGLVSTKQEWLDYKNLGYCLNGKGVNEEHLVSVLRDFPYQSPELQEALEAIPSLYERLN